MRNGLIFLLSFLVLACSSGNQDESVKTDSLQIDSISDRPLMGDNFLLQVNDSSTLDTVPLASALVKQWSFKELINDDYRLKNFLEIDSIKAAGKYGEYLEKLDIGMTKDSRAWIYDTLTTGDVALYIWGISYESYEACPYFSGKSIYLTTVANTGAAKATIQLTEISSGGDPPAFGSDWGSCEIGKDFITCSDTSTYGEYGDDGYDDVTISPVFRRYELSSDGSIILKETRKGAVVTTKRKQKN